MRVEDSGPSEIGDLRDQAQADPQRLGPRGEKRRIAALAVPESEIRAAGQMACSNPAMQDVRDEILRRHQAEFGVEGEFVDKAHAERSERIDALAREGEAEGGIVGAEHLARMRLEGENRERGVRAGGVGGAQHGGVAEMHAVEIAERHAGSAGRIRKIAPVAEDAHHARGSWTCASPSITGLPATAQVVLSVARCFAASSAVTSTVAVTVSPIFTGRRKRSVWPR